MGKCHYAVCGISLGLCCHACCCRNGMAPVHLAALKGHAKCIEFLVTKGVNINVQQE